MRNFSWQWQWRPPVIFVDHNGWFYGNWISWVFTSPNGILFIHICIYICVTNTWWMCENKEFFIGKGNHKPHFARAFPSVSLCGNVVENFDLWSFNCWLCFQVQVCPMAWVIIVINYLNHPISRSPHWLRLQASRFLSFVSVLNIGALVL